MPIIKFRNGNPVNNVKVTIEIFCAPNCHRCGQAADRVQEVISEIDNPAIQWRKIDVVDEIDYAVSFSIRATPAIVINGKLVFTSLPSQQILRREIERWLCASHS